MKKLILCFALALFSTSCTAQYYPTNDGYYSNNSSWNGDEDYYFPEDYYYEYPSDYYRDSYYQDFYNDYRQSIDMVNWNRFFIDYRLSRYQMEMILDLNRQFSSFYVWNNYYRMNPTRWYYDRFYALEKILGSRLFRIYYHIYYNGIAPVKYYVNHWSNYYRPKYYSNYVVPRYRTVNINQYRVNRYDYHQGVGNKYGWNQPRNPHNPGGFREDGSSAERRSGVDENNSSTKRIGGFRTEGDVMKKQESRVQKSTESSRGFRNQGHNERVLQNKNFGEERIRQLSQNEQSNQNNSGGFRNSQSPETRNLQRQRSEQPRNNPGFRSGSAIENSESRSERSNGRLNEIR